jgi:glycosyltransferase involved in cell wall biosynthesis
MQLIIINSHPIQYYAPMYKEMSDNGIDFEVWYCDDSGVKGFMDKGFGSNVQWDIPLLQGYKSKFFKNQSFRKSVSGSFFGVMNFNLMYKLFTTKQSIVMIHGWQFFTYFFAAIVAKLRGHKLWMRCEMPWNLEVKKTNTYDKAQRFLLKFSYLKLFSKFLYIGTQNKQYYKQMGISDSKLAFTPYAVDNNRFRNDFVSLNSSKKMFKESQQLPVDSKVILFTGKYIPQKNPLDLLKAFHQLAMKNVYLFFVGDGELRKEMEEYIHTNAVRNVVLTGFINQTKISEYYIIADLFVLCSSSETWGLSVNEAMCFNLPVIVSENCGCALDLVNEGVNGYRTRVNDVEDLKTKMEQVLNHPQQLINAGDASYKIVQNYSYTKTIKTIKQLL